MKKKYFALMLLIFAAVTGMKGQTAIPKAQSMFIYNFSRLIEWPADYKQGDFIIGVLGNSDVSTELELYTNAKKVGMQSIQIVKYKEPEEIQKCHILFVSYSKSNKMTDVLNKVNGYSTLLIGEKRGLITEGAAINFVITADKLKFELETANASKYGLKVNSKLASMAQ